MAIKLAAYNKRLQLDQPKDHPVTQAYFQDIVYKTVEQEKLVKELKKAILDIYIFLHPNATNWHTLNFLKTLFNQVYANVQ